MKPHSLIACLVLALAGAGPAAAQETRGARLDRAYAEVLAAGQTLREAEQRKERGTEPLPGERTVMPQAPGEAAAPEPATSLKGRKSRLNEAYFARQKKLELEVEAAHERYQKALEAWNAVK